MPTAGIVEFTSALKTLYHKRVAEVGYRDPRTWAMLKKTTDFVGLDAKIPIQYGRSQGSHTFATAQDRARASAYEHFLVTRGKHYHVMKLTGEGIEAGVEGPGAVVNYIKRETESAKKRSKHYLNRNLFKNHGGWELEIQSGAATPTITVTDIRQLIGIDVGDWLVSSTDDGSPSPGAGVVGTPTQVTALNRTLGTVTAAVNWSANGFADGHFAFLEGNYAEGYKGLASWLPRIAPAAGDSFYGMDRSKDPLRLAGQRFVATAADGTIERFLKRSCAEYVVQGGSGDVCIVSPILREQLESQLGNRVRYGRVAARTSEGPSAKLGFKSMIIQGEDMEMNIIGDRDCPYDTGYFLDMETIWFKGLGEAPRWLTYGGLADNGGWLRIGDEDGVEGRLGSKGQIVCDAPGCNANLYIPPATVGN